MAATARMLRSHGASPDGGPARPTDDTLSAASVASRGITAKEPAMSAARITLFAIRPGFGLPDASLFVLKTEAQLKRAGLDYEKVSAIPPQAPNA